jgi:hypothetical protein
MKDRLENAAAWLVALTLYAGFMAVVGGAMLVDVVARRSKVKGTSENRQRGLVRHPSLSTVSPRNVPCKGYQPIERLRPVTAVTPVFDRFL